MAFVVAAILPLVMALVMAFHDGRIERDRFAQKPEPVFEFSDTGVAYRQAGESEALGRYVVRRVIVRNLRHDDGGMTSTLPLLLVPQHSRERTDFVFSLAPGQSQPVDGSAVTERWPSEFYLFHTAVALTGNR